MESSDDGDNVQMEHQLSKESLQMTALDGIKFVEEVLNNQNGSCSENFRMDKKLFYNLCDILQAKGLLRHTNRIKIEEQLSIFLYTIGQNQRTRAVQERFQYSGETISRHFNNVLNAIVALSPNYFCSPGPDTPQEILEDPRFYPYFKNCVGVVDGTHIPVMVGVDEQGPFRNKHGFLSQNVMAACSLDRRFQYVLAGWEGSATDSCVLNAALTRRNKLLVPEGKFYLVDAEYGNIPGFIAPYLGVRYHLSEFSSDSEPQNAKELFNHRHSLLRSTIESTFKVWKTRFPILTSTPLYPLPTQVKLVIATSIIHNFIHSEKNNDWLFNMYEEGIGQQTESIVQAEIESETISNNLISDSPHNLMEQEIASKLRDSIAAEMWNDHIQELSNLGFDS